MAHVVMAYVAMAASRTAYTQCLYTHGPCSYGLCSNGHEQDAVLPVLEDVWRWCQEAQTQDQGEGEVRRPRLPEAGPEAEVQRTEVPYRLHGPSLPSAFLNIGLYSYGLYSYGRGCLGLSRISAYRTL